MYLVTKLALGFVVVLAAIILVLVIYASVKEYGDYKYRLGKIDAMNEQLERVRWRKAVIDKILEENGVLQRRES